MSGRNLITAYNAVTKDKIGPLAQNSLDKTADNTNYPDAEPYLAEIRDSLATYLPAAAILNPIPQQTALLKVYRLDLDGKVSALAKYANDLFPGNEAVLLSTGLPLAKAREKHTTLAPPSAFSLGDSSTGSALCAEFKRAPYAAATEARVTTDPSLPWWKWYAFTSTKNKITIRGFAKKDEVTVMLRSIGGDSDDQPFGDMLSRVVQ